MRLLRSIGRRSTARKSPRRDGILWADGMQGRQHGTEVPRFSVVWEAGRTPEAVGSVDHAAHYAMALAHALASAGYPPNRLEIAIQEPSPVRLELDVHGDVPGLDETSFASIARIAVSGCRIWQALPADADIRLRATLGAPSPVPLLPPPSSPEPEAPDASIPLIPAGVQAAAEEMPTTLPTGGHGTILGMVGLVALAALVYLVTHPPFQASAPAVTPAPARAAATATPAPPLTAVATVGGLRTILDERFVTPGGWPDDPRGSAWFGEGGYHLGTREPGEFVAVGAPLPEPVGEVVVIATFMKNAGPEGGGYGVVLRDQANAPLDGRTQDARFLLFEVGDRGEIAIWRRERLRWLPVMAWRHSEAVRPGLAENELKVIGHEDQVSFSVNGQQVAGLAYTDLPTRGGLGLFLGGDLNEVTVSRFSVQAP
jgi:osmotically inducible protein OsmC